MLIHEVSSETGENTNCIDTSSLFSQSDPYSPVRMCATLMQNCGISLKKSTMLYGINRSTEISPRKTWFFFSQTKLAAFLLELGCPQDLAEWKATIFLRPPRFAEPWHTVKNTSRPEPLDLLRLNMNPIGSRNTGFRTSWSGNWMGAAQIKPEM